MILVGIDPGVTTGLARWDATAQRLLSVESMPIHRAMDQIRAWREGFPFDRLAPGPLVIFEDARNHRVFNGRNARAGASVLQGVGSIKRDCSIWEDFLTDQGVPFVMRVPNSAATKWTAEYFNRVTGWTIRTNNHARDAATLVMGTNAPMASALLREALARRPTPVA
jgi:hypothetical protein